MSSHLTVFGADDDEEVLGLRKADLRPATVVEPEADPAGAGIIRIAAHQQTEGNITD